MRFIKRKAFTLVELLVVIAIIGLLSAVALITTNNTRAKSRNVKRISDIKQLTTAFSLGLDADGAFPSTGVNGSVCISASCYEGWSSYVSYATVDDFLARYMATKPVDPPGGARGYGGYRYFDNWGGGTSLITGVTYSGGPMITYLLETTPNVSCFGPLWNQTSNFTQCIVSLDNRF